ncbi:unnamed protein product [Mytilus edulis]|uniref:DZIP3-like HEPN domain-containing protein n=1 Tax=Mytilus edulis TaxID=6550 RepID=A0A8S3VEP1_MYTED|nr:unnamed protein product [Mytilus edulis]
MNQSLIRRKRIEQQEFDEIHSISGDKNTIIDSAAPHNPEDNIADPSDLFIENPNTETINSSVMPPVISEISNQVTHHIIETNMDDILFEAKFQRERMTSDGLVQCGIWDFAGQKDYYATHQTFFTPHAIYILVTDIEDEIGDTKHDQSFDSIGDYIGFWFDSIHCFCKDQSAVKLCPPVVMVITGSDKVPAEQDSELKFGEYKHYILEVMEKFEIIVKPQFLETNNRTYYIPCMVENSSTLKEIKRALKATNARCTPWLIFEFEFLPIVYYNHILFNYIRNYKVCKEMSGDTVGDGRPALYTGKAVVYLDDTRYKMLIICFSRNSIAIQIWRWSEVDDNTYKRILKELRGTIEELERKLMHKLHYEIKSKCNTGDYASASDRIGYAELAKRCVGENTVVKSMTLSQKVEDVPELIPVTDTISKNQTNSEKVTIIKVITILILRFSSRNKYNKSSKQFCVIHKRNRSGSILNTPVQLTKEELNFATICMVVLNILVDILYDLLKQDKPNMRPRRDCNITYLYSEHRRLKKHIPTNKWGGTWQDIQNTDIAIGDDIERIRLTRNDIQSSSTFALDEKHYKNICGIIVDIVERFDQHNKPSILYSDSLKAIFDKMSTEEDMRMGIIVQNILPDVLYDLLKLDKSNLRPRNDCGVAYLYSEHRHLNKHIPSNGWGGSWHNIRNTDIPIGDEIERIRLTRNELIHSPIFYLEEKRFNELCDILGDLLKRFDHYNKPTRLYTDELNEVLAKRFSSKDAE